MHLKTMMGLMACLAAAAGSASADWNANADLVANETLNGGAFELSNPNAVVPAWSYGWRSTFAGTGIGLFGGSAEHFNSFGPSANSANFQGWVLGGVSEPWLMAHIGNQTDQLFPGVDPVVPGEMAASPGRPGTSSEFLIVRWTAPDAGRYEITSALWRDIDTGGGNGQEFGIVAAGSVLLHGVIAGNGGAYGIPAPITLNLAAGDTVDFVLGPNGDYIADSTGFRATLVASPVPEPQSAWLALAGAGTLAALRRRCLQRPPANACA